MLWYQHACGTHKDVVDASVAPAVCCTRHGGLLVSPRVQELRNGFAQRSQQDIVLRLRVRPVVCDTVDIEVSHDEDGPSILTVVGDADEGRQFGDLAESLVLVRTAKPGGG